MHIVIGCDHRGKNMKAQLMEYIRNRGHEVEDCGAFDEECDNGCDYPDVAKRVAEKVSTGLVERGLLICGTGIGMSIVANKYPRVRAAVCSDQLTAEIARRHNNLNILCLSGDMVSEQAVEGIVNAWLDTPFENGRHQRRLDKLAAIERSLYRDDV